MASRRGMGGESIKRLKCLELNRIETSARDGIGVSFRRRNYHFIFHLDTNAVLRGATLAPLSNTWLGFFPGFSVARKVKEGIRMFFSHLQ